MLKAILKTQYKLYIMYKIYFISDFAGNIILPIFINILFWRGLGENNSLNYSMASLIEYIIMANLIASFSNVNVENILTGHIRTYKLAQELLLPVNYHKKLTVEIVMSKIIRFCFIYLPLMIILLLFSSKINLVYLILALPAIAISFALNFLFSEIIGQLSFWLTETWGISAIKNLVFSVFSGAIFPLDILPEKILSLFKFLPFQYMSFIPTKIFFGEFSFQVIFTSYGISIIWCLILLIIKRFIWSIGLKKYESCGA